MTKDLLCMKKVLICLTVMSLLVFGSVSLSFAGKVTINNNSSGTYYVMANYYYTTHDVGKQYHDNACATSGLSNAFEDADAVFYSLSVHQVSGFGSCLVPTPATVSKFYNIPGSCNASRKFTVTVAADGGITITEP